MFLSLLFLFILVPMADLLLLLIINKYITLIPTILLVLTTGLIGAWLAKQQWRRLLDRIRGSGGQMSAISELFSDGAMILMAGALLITPGLITDLIGLTLLVPACRRWYRKRFKNWIFSKFNVQVYSSQEAETEVEIVEGQVHRRKENNQGSDGPDRIEASPF